MLGFGELPEFSKMRKTRVLPILIFTVPLNF
jgi:hypothetical protein